jgi:hypothetical protein
MRALKSLAVVGAATVRLKTAERRVERWALRSEAGELPAGLRAAHAQRAASLLDALDGLVGAARFRGAARARRAAATRRFAAVCARHDRIELGLRAFAATDPRTRARVAQGPAVRRMDVPVARACIGLQALNEATCAAENALRYFNAAAQTLEAMMREGDVGDQEWNRLRGVLDRRFADLLEHCERCRALQPGARMDAKVERVVAMYREWLDALDGADNHDPAY